MALSSPESPVPPRRVVINRTENPSEEHEELNMAHGVVAESRRFVLLVGFSFMSVSYTHLTLPTSDLV